MIADDFVSPIQLPSVPGDYFLLWMLNPLEAEWRVQTEVAVDGVVFFRHRKAHDSTFPSPRWAAYLRVT